MEVVVVLVVSRRDCRDGDDTMVNDCVVPNSSNNNIIIKCIIRNTADGCCSVMLALDDFDTVVLVDDVSTKAMRCFECIKL